MRRPDTPGVIAPPPLIPFACVAAGIALERWLPVVLPWPAWTGMAGKVVIGAGGVLALWAFVEFLRWKTSPEPWHPSTHVITTGPFRLSRNPIYVGFLLAHLGIGLMRTNIWTVLTLVPAFFLLKYGVVLREERYLADKFGPAYLTYRNSVRRWL